VPKHHEWRESALKVVHTIRSPDFYIAYGALQEAARALEIARTFKHHKEAAPKMEAAMKAAMERYVAAFNKEVGKASFDPLLTDEPECRIDPDGVHLSIEIRANTTSTFANYWPGGPVDLPNLSKIKRLHFWEDAARVSPKEMTSIEDVAQALLERHLRIRAAELIHLALSRAPRDAWRDAKHVLNEYHIGIDADQEGLKSVNAMASDAIRECFHDSANVAGYREHILDIADRLQKIANRTAGRLKAKLIGAPDDPDRPTALFIKEVR